MPGARRRIDSVVANRYRDAALVRFRKKLEALKALLKYPARGDAIDSVVANRHRSAALERLRKNLKH